MLGVRVPPGLPFLKLNQLCIGFDLFRGIIHMSAKTDTAGSSLDTVKLSAALALLVGSIVGYYYFEEESLLYRVLGMLAVIAAGVWVALTTAKGKGLLNFMTGARTEVRKMVWPTRVETMQTTLMVFIIVVLLSIFLWVVDMLLGAGIKWLLAVSVVGGS